MSSSELLGATEQQGTEAETVDSDEPLTGPVSRHVGDPDRLAAIARLGLHGHLGDPHLDAVVATVAAACAVPLAVVTIVTPDHQTYPSEVGVDACSTDVPDRLSFCAEVVRTGRRLVVSDATAHPVYAANPLVVAGAIAAYAGEPLMHGNHIIGALSIFDNVPREFTTQELDVLRAQARLAMAAVQLRVLELRIGANAHNGAVPPVAAGPRKVHEANDPRSPDESLILRMHGGGASPHTIAAALNAEGSRTSLGTRWHVRSVARVIAPPLPLHRHASATFSTRRNPIAPP